MPYPARATAIALALAVGVAAVPVSSSVPAYAHGTHGHSHGHSHSRDHSDEIVSAARAFVADAADAVVHVVDLTTGEVIDTIAVAGPARLHRGASLATIVATHPAAGLVSFLGTGLSLDDHGDHEDLAVEAPRLLAASLAGGRPAHVNRDGDRIAVFLDDEGAALIVQESEILAGGDARAVRIDAGGPHHGLAKPAGPYVAVSAPTEGERLPDRIRIVDAAGEEVAEIACPRAHGEGQSGGLLAFGCADGVAVLTLGPSGPEVRRVAYPAEHDGRLVRNLAGASGFSAFLADFGPDGMAIVDPTAEDGLSFVALPARRMHFALAGDPGDRGFVIVEDGRLLALNALTGAALGEVQATGRYSMEQGVLRPRLSTGGGYVVATDPQAGEIVVIDAGDLSVKARIAVGGAPSDVVVVAASGLRH